jgi:uncharacterized protein YjbI with pentapeptide repeats/DNA-binding Xre family transcriptional regulator
MTDSSLPKKKKKVTLTASAQGLITAENALVRLGFESKSNFAASQLISRSTVTKFFQGEPIQLDSLKRICDALELTWQEIAGMSAAEQRSLSGIELKISDETEEVGKMQTLRRQVTVVDPNSGKVKAVITLEGNVDSVDNWETFQLILQQHSGCSINIIDIESGSIRLTVEGSQADIQKLVDKIRAGKRLIRWGGLTKLNGFSIKDIEILAENSDIETSNKWNLVKEIIDRRIIGQNLSGADLSGTDLSHAYLRDADLRDADLSDADLIRADLSGADLSHANLSCANLSRTYLRDANLSGASLSCANLHNANLSRTYAPDADLSGANLSGANLSGANLSGTYLSGASLSGTNLSGANLSGANLSGANLSGANLSGANLSGATLSGANLSGADLKSADLKSADLKSADLKSADLKSADLKGADLKGADVENTRFGDNQGISASMKLDLKKRGAIFEDYPGDRSETYALR